MTETIIGAEKTLDERLEAYNAKRKALDEEYGFVLTADAYIENGLIKARPSLLPVEALPQTPVETPEEHIHEAKDKKQKAK